MFFNNPHKQKEGVAMWDPFAEFEHDVMANGLSVYCLKMNRPWVHIGFLIHCGSRQDPPGKEGLAHFVEHCVAHNLPRHRSDKAKSYFEGLGGQVNFGEINYFITRYSFFIPLNGQELKKALRIFGTMLLTLQLIKKTENQRKVIIEEINEDYPHALMQDLIIRRRRALHHDHPAARFCCPLGRAECVKKISTNEIQKFYDQYYTPANISVVCVGGLTLKELMVYLKNSPFSIVKLGKRNPIPTQLKFVSPPTETRHDVYISDYSKVPISNAQYNSYTVIPGVVSFEGLRILTFVLEDILNKQIRDRDGFSYGFTVDHLYLHDVYELAINGRMSATAIELVESTIEDSIRKVAQSEDLFHHHKRSLLANCKMVDCSGKEICLAAMSDLGCDQRIITLTESIRNYRRLRVKHLHELLSHLKPERRWTLLQYP